MKYIKVDHIGDFITSSTWDPVRAFLRDSVLDFTDASVWIPVQNSIRNSTVYSVWNPIRYKLKGTK